MSNISVRGIDVKALAELKARAKKENASVNSVVLRLIDQGLGRKPAKPTLRRHDDLDALVGSWQRDEARRFERATAPFNSVDVDLWK